MLTRKLRRPIVGLAACVLVGSAFVATPASAAPSAGDPSFAPSALASKLDSQFGSRTAGSYIDASGRYARGNHRGRRRPPGPGAGRALGDHRGTGDSHTSPRIDRQR